MNARAFVAGVAKLAALAVHSSKELCPACSGSLCTECGGEGTRAAYDRTQSEHVKAIDLETAVQRLAELVDDAVDELRPGNHQLAIELAKTLDRVDELL